LWGWPGTVSGRRPARWPAERLRRGVLLVGVLVPSSSRLDLGNARPTKAPAKCAAQAKVFVRIVTRDSADGSKSIESGRPQPSDPEDAMPTRRHPGAVRLTLVALIGLAASLFLAAPANADAPPVIAINDNNPFCTHTGDILVRWHIQAQFPVNIDNLQSVPSGELWFPDGHTTPWVSSAAILQLVPSGTTTSGLTFTWTEAGNPQNTGTGTGTTTTPYPTCHPSVSAAFVSHCDRLVDVTLHNEFEGTIVFSVNGSEHAVAFLASTTIADVPANDNDAVDVVIPYKLLGGVMPVATYTWTDPGGCPTPTPTADASLPLTGSSLTGVVGIGGGLLAAGALLVVVSVLLRRRRTNAKNGST
jgi:hypothetical protein